MPHLKSSACLISLATLALSVGVLPTRADSPDTTERTVTELGPGIYTIRHPDAPDEFPQGNTTVVIGTEAVLVVDSCYLPSAAREDIAQIRKWTNLPVRYLANTHWHYDHQLGNGEYAAAFPGLVIVAHAETARHIAGYNPGWFARYDQLGDRYRKAIETGKRRDGTPLTPGQIASLKKALVGRASVSAEFKAQPGRVPNLTFADELTIDLGGRTVQLQHLGRGNTAGDIVAYLPRERIVATGDLVDSPVPYIGSGYPRDQVVTLGRLLELDADTYVPGHGAVLRGESGHRQLVLLRDFLKDVTTQVSAAVHRLGNDPAGFEEVKAEVEKAVDFNAWRTKFAGDDKSAQDFFDGFPRPGAVQAAFAETWPE